MITPVVNLIIRLEAYPCATNDTELIHILLEYKPLLDVNFEVWGNKTTPLKYAVGHRNIDVMKFLLDREADPDNNSTWENNTALHMAAAGGWLEEIELLLSYGASVDPMDACLRETPLYKAARNLQIKDYELYAHGVRIRGNRMLVRTMWISH
jgi:ankyrin repeat protein